MIVLKYIEIHPKSCIWKIIVKWLRVFINFSYLNTGNVSGAEIRCLCVKCKDKKLHHKDVILEKNT